ncbi:MAG: CaiB/BaiF CoA-transferase family protein [Alphaproteobacteria bacterium]|nr:CaiB/BaiF CoA-transferase family protein [Alphaproteobacteria bacterium]MCY4318156.1 CaiB/BaiF CoA-transferase family protein [Alphaproteobacteria bacterium]
MHRPLEGLLVLSLEQAVAAPFLTARLADAGARVIKLERREGDFARGYDNYVRGNSTYFVYLNRGKQSLVVDIKHEDDRALLHRILARADVWVQNLAPGAAVRAGFGSAVLRDRYPRLITVDISGYGETGPPYDRMKAYDLLVQAESGVASVTGSEAEPGRIGVSACDIATGMFSHAAVLEALIKRGVDGKGSAVKASLFASMADWMSAPLMWHEYAGRTWPRMALRHPALVPYGAFKTLDGHQVMIACQNDREWRRFAEMVLERPDLATAPGYATQVARVDNRAEVEAVLEDILGALDRETLRARLAAADVAFGSVNTVADLSEHPALRCVEIDTPGGPVSHVAPAVYFDGEPREYGPVPEVNEHGALIREEFSL